MIDNCCCLDLGSPTAYSIHDVWFNSFGPTADGKLTGTLSWASPQNQADVKIFKLLWGTSCDRLGIIPSDLFLAPFSCDSWFSGF